MTLFYKLMTILKILYCQLFWQLLIAKDPAVINQPVVPSQTECATWKTLVQLDWTTNFFLNDISKKGLTASK